MITTGFWLWDSPIVEKNDLSPHSATKTKKKVLITVLATDNIPAPFPENFETANSAWFKCKKMTFSQVNFYHDINVTKHCKNLKRK